MLPSRNNGAGGERDPLRYNCFILIAFRIIFCMLTAGCCLITCTPPPAVIRKCPEPVWKEYTSFKAYQVENEIVRLEALLKIKDTVAMDSSSAADTLSELDIRQRLFELSIHHANPVYDFNKIFDFVSYLYQHGGTDSLRYLNWGRAQREWYAVAQARDSVQKLIGIIAKEDRSDAASAELQKKELRNYQKQCDSLTAIISTQQETISKLQKLDVLMEQQRSKIQ